jgi:GT2 family glycosyltransferase
MLRSVCSYGVFPRQVIIVDASSHQSGTSAALAELATEARGGCIITHERATSPGAASQRTQGVGLATEKFIVFLDDDIEFQSSCLQQLFHVLTSDSKLGGVSAMIVNQSYLEPRWISRTMFTLMSCRGEKSFAGRVIGPAINLLPEDRNDLPEIVPVEWVNTTCTMYRREALPDPPFDPFFTGYSLMEDLALSLNVAKQGWKLANVRTARIFHDSQPGQHKSNVKELARMELVNRHYVMTKILGRETVLDYGKLAAFQLFNLVGGLRDWRNWPRVLAGKITGIGEILHRRRLSKKDVP